MSKVPSLSWAGVSARRLARSGLSAPWPSAGADDVAAAICGAHAQVASAGELSIAALEATAELTIGRVSVGPHA